MSSVPDFSQAPAAAAVEAVTPPGSDPLTAPLAEPDAEDSSPAESGDGAAPGA